MNDELAHKVTWVLAPIIKTLPVVSEHSFDRLSQACSRPVLFPFLAKVHPYPLSETESRFNRSGH